VRRVLEKHPNDAGAIMLRGHAQWARNGIEAALKDFTQSAAIDPSNYVTHYNRASALGQLKRPDEGIAAAAKAIDLNPRDPRGFRLRATLYQDLGQYSNALRDYINAFLLDDSVETLQLIGQTYRKEGRVPDSIEQFADQFKLNVKSTTPRIVRARLYLVLKNNAAAVKDLDEVIRSNPRLPIAYELRADAKNGLGDQAAYEDDLRKVIELDPKNDSALNNLAYALVSQPDRLTEARGLIIQAMRYAPDNANYLDTRGWIEYGLGNFTDAELYLRQAAMGSGNDTIQEHLAKALLRNGDIEGAREHWRLAVQSLESQTPLDSKRVAELKRALDEATKAPLSTRPIAVLAVVKVRCDIDCVVGIDGRDIRRARAGVVTRIVEFVGKHSLSAISMDGFDTWNGELDVTAASDLPADIPLKAAREARKEREKVLISLNRRLPILKRNLEQANQQLALMRAEAAKAVQNNPLEKRRRADELRDRLVSYIESLERALSWENGEASRLQNAAQEAESVGDSSTVGQIVGLIGKGASIKHQSSAAAHKDRANRLLNRIDSLTTELGKLAETDDIPESHIPVPPSRFDVSYKEGSQWIPGEVTITGGDLQWKSANGSVQCQCSELKSAKPGKEADFSVEYRKTRLTFRAAGADARGQLMEVWYMGCPQHISW
jgi:tetratricopeptide (TPR) repeat protein